MLAKKTDFRRTLPLFLVGFVPVSLLIAALGAWHIYEQKRVVLERYQVEASHHVEGQVRRVQRFYRQGIAVLLALARDKAITPALADNAGARRGVANAFIDIMRISDVYDQIRLLDSSGQEIVRVNRQSDGPHVVPAGQLQNKGRRGYVRQALALSGGGVYVSPFDLNMERGEVARPYKAMIRLATPLVDINGIKNGILVINLLGIHVMQRELSESVLEGEHLLINAGSPYWFDRHMDELQLLEGVNDVEQAHLFSRDWLSRLKEDENQFATADGRFIFKFIAPIPSGMVAATLLVPQWKIVSFVPAASLNAAVGAPSSRTTEVCAAAIVLFGFIIWFWSGRHVLQRIAAQQRDLLLKTRGLLAQNLIEVREEERIRLARMLHDEVAQDLHAIQMQAVISSGDCSEKKFSAAADGMHKIQDICGRLMGVIRGHLQQLRPLRLEELGLKEALGALCADWENDCQVSCRMQVDDAANKLEDAVQLNIYRIVQEALTNVVRHAQASQVRVDLKVQDGKAILNIEDDGEGFDVDAANGGLGLAGMRERCALFGGGMQLEGEPGGGTRIRIELPRCGLLHQQIPYK